VGIHRLLHSSCRFLKTHTAITLQLIRTTRTLETERWQVCGETLVRRQEDYSSTGRVWAAGFHRVTVHSRLARILKIMNRLCFFFFPPGCGKPPVLHFSHVEHERSSLYFSSTTFRNFPGISDLLSEVFRFQHHKMLYHK